LSEHGATTDRARRILVVDDDAALQRTVRLILASEGFDVTIAADGVRGLEALASGDFDAVVLDLQMPEMDGREMFEAMRRRGDRTPVLFLSAYGAEQASLDLGAQGGLAKPFDVDVLIEAVSSLLSGSIPARNGDHRP